MKLEFRGTQITLWGQSTGAWIQPRGIDLGTHQTPNGRPPGHRNESTEAPEDRTEHTHHKRGTKVAVRKCIVIFLKIQSSCQNRGDASGCQVTLGKGPWHLCVHKVCLQVPLSFHVDYSSTRARVSQGLQNEARLLSNLEAQGQMKKCLVPMRTQPFQRAFDYKNKEPPHVHALWPIHPTPEKSDERIIHERKSFLRTMFDSVLWKRETGNHLRFE